MTSPLSVVQAYYAAVNGGHVNDAVVLFADDAVRTSLAPPNSPMVIIGKEQIRAAIQTRVADSLAVEPYGFQVTDNKVACTTRYATNFLRGEGIAPLEQIDEFVIQEGNIKSYTSTATPESLAKMHEAENSLRRVTGHVWIFPPYGPQPLVGVIATETQTVLIDSGQSQAHARRVQAALGKINAPPVKYIILTHHHWDHVLGASVFGALPIAHEAGREILVEFAARPWSYRYIDQEVQKDPSLELAYRGIRRALDEDGEARIVVPVVTFSHRMCLHLEDLVVEIEHVGGVHAPDSSVVRVKDDGVLFMGDCFHKLDSPSSWSMLEALVNDSSVEIGIQSHDRPKSRAEWLEMLASDNVYGFKRPS